MKKLLLLMFCVTSLQAKDSNAIIGMVFGEYDLIGKSIGNNNTYFGQVSIEGTDDDIQVIRIINGKTTKGKATINKTIDGVKVLRIRFRENEKQYEKKCLIDIDLDNYARLTCHLYIPNETKNKPGLEAMFIRHDE
ncbi:MAG: hypothetical protein AB8B80_05355 [Marinicellaceae bacterium]